MQLHKVTLSTGLKKLFLDRAEVQTRLHRRRTLVLQYYRQHGHIIGIFTIPHLRIRGVAIALSTVMEVNTILSFSKTNISAGLHNRGDPCTG